MTKNIISLLLLVISAGLSLKHGWDAFQPANAQQDKMMADLSITPTLMPYFGVYSILIGILLFFPQTFFISNVLHAVTIVVIMALALSGGHYKIALIEIPFLLIPLLMIWLKYPFKN